MAVKDALDAPAGADTDAGTVSNAELDDREIAEAAVTAAERATVQLVVPFALSDAAAQVRFETVAAAGVRAMVVDLEVELRVAVTVAV